MYPLFRIFCLIRCKIGRYFIGRIILLDVFAVVFLDCLKGCRAHHFGDPANINPGIQHHSDKSAARVFFLQTCMSKGPCYPLADVTDLYLADQGRHD